MVACDEAPKEWHGDTQVLKLISIIRSTAVAVAQAVAACGYPTHLNSLQSAPDSATGRLSGMAEAFWYVWSPERSSASLQAAGNRHAVSFVSAAHNPHN